MKHQFATRHDLGIIGVTILMALIWYALHTVLE